MSDKLRNLINSIGALSEFLGVMRTELEKNGFTREESVYLVGIVLETMLKNIKGSS
ncbi:hypothetical protein CCDG5_1974 [[Clostridium] cellulosi]|jgi:hypothetical protein|uniref:Uncharacterized protein n=1 Tax=[Clostridium] cellulosi TaxID=29343 RepID=A0A078KMS1_9FIRM|nr:hypothetical protein CCDG5_1974 [[Clostridium] cellulosi]